MLMLTSLVYVDHLVIVVVSLCQVLVVYVYVKRSDEAE